MALRRLQVICRFCRLICPFLWIYAAFISKISLVLIWTCDFQIHLKLFLNGILSLVLNGIDLMQITHTYVCEFWEIPNELFFVPFCEVAKNEPESSIFFLSVVNEIEPFCLMQQVNRLLTPFASRTRISYINPMKRHFIELLLYQMAYNREIETGNRACTVYTHFIKAPKVFSYSKSVFGYFLYRYLK